MKKLGELLEAVGPIVVVDDANVDIKGIAHDSRRVSPGDIFVALPGRTTDGNKYIDDALARGAVAVASELPNPPAGLGVPYVVVASATRALSRLSAALYDFPARRLGVIGVTGTDGKTTTVHITASILEAAGHRVGRLSTVDAGVGFVAQRNETNHTTPQAPDLQRLLADMVAAGAEYAVIEASSHALALDRVADAEFDVAVLTNITPEHLDFHRTLERYRHDKANLFRLVGASADKGIGKFGVVNADDPQADYFRRACPAPVLAYGIDAGADVTASDLQLTPAGSRFTVATPDGEIDIATRLVGRYNVYNWLAAITVAVGLGVDAAAASRAAATVQSVPGRMQLIDVGQPFTVIVDFAHTPHALEMVLSTLRAQTRGRLIVVFGHAGRRDVNNRPRLGQVAARLSDLAVVTSDDSYDEDPTSIIEHILDGIRALGGRYGQDYVKVFDRREGIAYALARARPGDLVLISGRGPDRYQIVGDRKSPFEDGVVARELLSELFGLPGQPAA